MGSRAAKEALFDSLASVASALGNGRRAELVDVLAQGERSVDDVAQEIGQSVANTSHHLRVLAKAGIVTTRRDGTKVIYRLASDAVEELWRAMRVVACAHRDDLDRLADAYLGADRDLETITRTELAERLERGDIIVIDVRPESEYRSGHIAGARSLPVKVLRRRLRELPRDAEVVAYCRGPFCVFADDATRMLQRNGLRARRLEDGYPEWRHAGLPIAAALEVSQ